MNSIKQAIRSIGGVEDAVRLFDAEILSVDRAKRVCEVVLIGGKSSNQITVRLMASIDDGCLLIPKVGSNVIVSMSDYILPFISQYSEIEEIEWLGGDYDGVPIVVHPTDHSKGLLAKINQLENKIKDLQTIFSTTWTPVANDGGAALKAATTAWAGTPYIITQQADIEHPNITH